MPLVDAGLTTDRIALGVYPVHPIDQAVGYATLCNGGNRVTPFLVRSVKTAERRDALQRPAQVDPRLDPKITRTSTTRCSRSWPPVRARRAAIGDRQVAGKTGTTQNNTNAWFIGCSAPAKSTGQLVTAVWVGHAATVTPLTDIPGFEKGVFGGQIPAGIFQTS